MFQPVLHDINAPQPHAGFQLSEAKIRYTDIARFALADDVVENAHRLLERHVWIGPVDEIDIDVISGEIGQTLLERGHDPCAATVAAIGCLRIADADLGNEADVASTGTERPGERLLGDAHAVGFGGVEAIDPSVECAMHRLFELRRIDRAIGAADFPAAKAYGGNLDVRSAELPVFHGRFPIVWLVWDGTIQPWPVGLWLNGPVLVDAYVARHARHALREAVGRWINDTRKSQSKHLLRPVLWRQYRCGR